MRLCKHIVYTDTVPTPLSPQKLRNSYRAAWEPGCSYQATVSAYFLYCSLSISLLSFFYFRSLSYKLFSSKVFHFPSCSDLYSSLFSLRILCNPRKGGICSYLDILFNTRKHSSSCAKQSETFLKKSTKKIEVSWKRWQRVYNYIREKVERGSFLLFNSIQILYSELHRK